jgi:hypothetical protein
MTFENLFQDLESQLERELDAELLNRIDDEERERRSKLTLRERLVALQQYDAGVSISAFVSDGTLILFSIKNVGKDWILAEITEPAFIRGSVLVPLASLMSVNIPEHCEKTSLGAHVAQVTDVQLEALAARPRLAHKVSFAFVLRDIGRRRKTVTLHTRLAAVTGTIDHVGVDHLDVHTGTHSVIYPLREVLYLSVQ